MRRVILLALLAAAVPFLSGAAKNAWDTWRQGYETYLKGEASRDRGEYTRALEFFQKSLELYREIQRTRPDWDQNVIRTRIADSEREIANVRKLLGAEAAPSAPEPEVPAAPGGIDFVEQESRKNELELFRKKLFDLTAENELLRKENDRLKASEVDALKLLREQRVLQEKCTLLEQLNKAQERKLQEPDTRLEELRKQLVEEKLNSGQLAKRLQLAETRGQKLDKDLIELDRQKSFAEAESRKSAADVLRITRELEELRRYKDDSVKQLAAAEAAAAETGLKLKTAEESLTARTAEVTVLNRRLADAVKGGGSGLSAEMLAENKRLKEEAAAVGKALEAAAVEALTLKNQHRAAQLELVQQREALQRIEVLRLAVEKENAALTKQLELEKASGELSSVELRNLRERNVKLEGDMKSWSERCAKLEEQLKNRDSAVSKSIEAGDAANRELAAEIKSLKEQLATQNRELKVLLDQKSSQEKALAAATTELAGKKSALLLAEEKLKKAGEGLARLGKLEPEFKTLQVNFQAMQKELAAGRKAAEELNASKTALAAAQTRLKELEAVAAKFLAEQKRNQSLAEEVSRLKGELEARPVAAAVPAEPVPAVSGVAVPADRTPAELLAAGRREEAAERWELAIWNYEAALAAEPGNAEAALRLGNLYLRREEFARAEPLLAKASARNPNDPTVAAARAEALIGLGKFGNALGVLETPLKERPKDFRLQMARAKAFAGSGRQTDAAAGFELAAKLAPASPEPLLGLARLRLADGKEKEAAEFYRQARLLGAGPDAGLEPKLGKQLTEQRELAAFMSTAAAEAAANGDWTSALWYYRQLSEIDTGNRLLPLQMAFGHIQTGSCAQALEIVAMNPASAESDAVKILAYLKQNRFEEARKAAEEALARSGGKPLALSPAWPGLGAELEAQKKLPELGKSVAGMACAKLLDKLLPGAGK